VDLSESSHVNYPEIKTYKLAEQTGSYTLNPHGKSTVAKACIQDLELSV
jgi:hypothetical protein